MAELITASELSDELHIDQTPEELATLGTLIQDASAIVRGSISPDLTEADALTKAPEQFNRLVGSVATSLYYDRALTNGFSHGQMIILQQLNGIVKGGA
ncbi:head-tail connector protein [Weissella confusa]|uniref:head-tail connector protein n=1 Tax=Weissella confusa TaxID=1583 RepID=UPI0021A2BFEB|nr:head-tail connector protein [Weissella confusa]MCT2911817.1 phage gp6-like head-tail connector protein [Weissella confusa]